MSLVLEEWPVLGAWVSVSSLWGTLSWDLSVRPSSPYWHGTCCLSPPTMGACAVCALLHPPNFSFCPTVLFPYSESP